VFEMRVPNRKIVLNSAHYRQDPFHLHLHSIEYCVLGFDTLGNTPEVKCYSGISVRLWILSYPPVYPGGSYAHPRCATSGEVKKYQ
jgi:hypothetical protein